MNPIVAARPNIYTGNPLEWATEKREDTAWIAAALDGAETLFVPVWRSRNLMRGVAEGRPEAAFLTGETTVAMRDAPWAFLGLQGPRPVFAVDVSATEDPLALVPAGVGTFTDLRAVAGALPGGEASILAHARGLMHWRVSAASAGAPARPGAPATSCGARPVTPAIFPAPTPP